MVVEMTRVLDEFAALRMKLTSDVYEPEGVRAQTIRPWQMYLANVDRAIAKLSSSDQAIAGKVKQKFLQQCDRFSSVSIQIPELRVPKNADLSRYDYDRDKHPVAVRAEAIGKQIEKAESEIAGCFRTIQ